MSPFIACKLVDVDRLTSAPREPIPPFSSLFHVHSIANSIAVHDVPCMIARGDALAVINGPEVRLAPL